MLKQVLPISRLKIYFLFSIAIILVNSILAGETFATRPKPAGRLYFDRPIDSRFDARSEIKRDDIDQPHVALFQLNLTAKDIVTIDAQSDEFNVKLRIIDAAGKILSEDDDSGIGNNAHLIVNGSQFNENSLKDLKVELTSQGSWDIGNYSLTIVRGDLPVPQGKEKIEADIAYFERAAALAALAHSTQRQGWVMANLAWNYSLVGRYDQMREKATLAQQLATETHDSKLLATALKNIGAAAWYEGKAAEAIPLFEQSLKLRRECGDRKGEANSLNNLGLAYQQTGKIDQAIKCFEQALQICRDLDDLRGAGNELGNLGIAHYMQKDYDRALELYEQSLKIRRETGDKRGEAYDLGNIGVVYAKIGEYQRAIVYYELAINLRRELGDKRGEQVELINIAKACVFIGEIQRAVEYKKASDRIKAELVNANQNHY